MKKYTRSENINIIFLVYIYTSDEYSNLETLQERILAVVENMISEAIPSSNGSGK